MFRSSPLMELLALCWENEPANTFHCFMLMTKLHNFVFLLISTLLSSTSLLVLNESDSIFNKKIGNHFISHLSSTVLFHCQLIRPPLYLNRQTATERWPTERQPTSQHAHRYKSLAIGHQSSCSLLVCVFVFVLFRNRILRANKVL
jgi:hypothetical protein